MFLVEQTPSHLADKFTAGLAQIAA